MRQVLKENTHEKPSEGTPHRVPAICNLFLRCCRSGTRPSCCSSSGQDLFEFDVSSLSPQRIDPFTCLFPLAVLFQPLGKGETQRGRRSRDSEDNSERGEHVCVPFVQQKRPASGEVPRVHVGVFCAWHQPRFAWFSVFGSFGDPKLQSAAKPQQDLA